MPTKRPTRRWGRVVTLVPLAVLSAAWTASLVGVGSPVALAGDRPNPTLPDGTSVPAKAISAPASVSTPQSLGPGVGNADTEQIVATADAAGIPSAALSAYQRAETVINAADKSCHLTWQLIAAIGRVESNHGRADGNTLTDAGMDTPGIFGPVLNGSDGTTQIADTDGGQYDSDKSFDRAVGPMQFIPSTWSVVGVDADGDGVRNPQDINDAALATAVYLCSGNDDLSTDAGRRAAVYRYNHSQTYVTLVLAVMQAYLQGDFTSIPNDTVMAGQMAPASPLPRPQPHFHASHTTPTAQPTAIPTSKPTSKPTTRPTPTATASPTTQSTPTSKPTNKPTHTSGPSLPPLPSTSLSPIDQVLTLAQAIVQCTADGISQLNAAAWQQCLDYYTQSH